MEGKSRAKVPTEVPGWGNLYMSASPESEKSFLLRLALSHHPWDFEGMSRGHPVGTSQGDAGDSERGAAAVAWD